MAASSGAGERDASAPGTLPVLVPGLRWRRVVPGEERQLGVVRRWLESLLPPCAARDDVAVVASELVGNAVKHTASGRGGQLAVEIGWHGPVVRVAVADCGAPTAPRVIEDLAGEHGRGLLLVRGLSARTGVCGDDRGRLVWADVPWVAVPGEVGALRGDAYEAAIRDGEAALARRFAGVPAWFGRSTLAWWAMPGPGALVTAPSARELAGVLYRLLDASPPPQPPPAAQAHPQTRGHAEAGRQQRPGPASGVLSQAPSRVTAPPSTQSARPRTLAGAMAGGGR